MYNAQKKKQQYISKRNIIECICYHTKANLSLTRSWQQQNGVPNPPKVQF